MADTPSSSPGIVLYASPDGKAKLSVRLEGQTVWLTQAQMAELFQTTKQNISLHIQNILEEGELPAEATVKDYLTVQTEGNRSVERSVGHYNLGMIADVMRARVVKQCRSNIQLDLRSGCILWGAFQDTKHAMNQKMLRP